MAEWCGHTCAHFISGACLYGISIYFYLEEGGAVVFLFEHWRAPIQSDHSPNKEKRVVNRENQTIFTYEIQTVSGESGPDTQAAHSRRLSVSDVFQMCSHRKHYITQKVHCGNHKILFTAH